MPWEIWNTASNRRAGMAAGWPTEESARREIESWIQRYHKGGRPDLSLEYLMGLEPKEYSLEDYDARPEQD